MSRKSGFVAIVGRPNSGKSTLLNRILKSEVSIVSEKAQTTRERVLGILSEPQGQMVFIDTPGIHRAKAGGINEYMVSEARQALEGPDLIWYLVDPSTALVHEEAVLNLLLKAGKSTPVFLVMNKSDRGQGAGLEIELSRALTERGIQHSVWRISGLRGQGVRGLLDESWRILPKGVPHFPDEEMISDRPVRFFVAEKIREQLFMKLGEEIPYSCAVRIEKFDENSQPPRIEAEILVERESQKPIVIGQGGRKIKEIGQAAREQIEKFLGQHVFLGLRVKVLRDWTKDADALKRLGYSV